jgi:phosphatidylserine/phosphatidylglycerophosphate/cardiolipin synthase-like enzyme
MGSMNDNVKLYEQRLSYRSNAAPCQCLAQPWFVRTPWKGYYPRHRCLIEPLICGERVFGKIAEDLEKAAHSVDIITWGFDPGMVLVRGRTAEDGERYGELLKRIATRKKNPVKVRLLVWHDDLLSHLKMNNIPILFGKLMPYLGGLQNSYYSETHQNYTAEWLAQVIAGDIPNILFHVRHVPYEVLTQSLTGESVPKGGAAELSKLYASHHQKMLLIDYERAASATGYVMGHNSLTDFWDTGEHRFRDLRRERFYDMDHADLQKKAWQEGVQYDGVGRLRAAGYLKPIYVFLLTSTPESDGMDVPTYDVASKVGMSDHMKVEHQDALERARQKNIRPPITAAELADRGINVFMGSLWTCADAEGKLRPTDYEEIYIHAKVAVVDDAAFTIGSANLNLRSMAMDSELNVLSEAKDVAFQLRSDLFSQCAGDVGPVQFGDMTETFKQWGKMAFSNLGKR